MYIHYSTLRYSINVLSIFIIYIDICICIEELFKAQIDEI